MKKNCTLWICLIAFAATKLHAQDIPLFTQKLTNSFLYNPSVAGNTLGSLTLSHRQYWSGMEGSPQTNFLSVHTPFHNHRFGVGANVFQDKIGVTKTLYTSAAFAYHIRITDTRSFSMGVSFEYDRLNVDHSKVDVIDQDDIMLSGTGAYDHVDFSFGVSYHTQYMRLGAAVNRLGSLTHIVDSTTQFPAYYSAFVNFLLPIANERGLLEPTLTYRSFAPGSSQLDAGLFYTHKSLVTLGTGYRTSGPNFSGGAFNVTLSVRLHKNIVLGYSREMFAGEIQKNLGASNEFVLRLDFMDHAFYSKSKNARSINTEAMAFQRKTLTKINASHMSPSHRNQRYKKIIKRNYIHSPNYRIESSKKLQKIKVKRGNSFNKSKRKQ